MSARLKTLGTPTYLVTLILIFIGVFYFMGRGNHTIHTALNKCIKVHNGYYSYLPVQWIGNTTILIIICPIHGKFLQTYNTHSRGGGCIKCGWVRSGKYQVSNQQDFIKKLEKVWPDLDKIFDLSKTIYIRSNQHVEVVCLKHGTWKVTPHNFLRGRGCPECKSSKGEQRIQYWLDKHHIEYIKNKNFKTCRGIKNPLPFDFYIPDYNLLIEFDGRQHFEPCFNDETGKIFNATKTNDIIKTKWAKDNEYTLLRIPYTEFNKIENILENKLSTLKCGI